MSPARIAYQEALRTHMRACRAILKDAEDHDDESTLVMLMEESQRCAQALFQSAKP